MARNYRYRGRRSPGKGILAVILSLIIVASVGFIFLQEKILFFDETGTAYFRLPGQTREETELLPEEVDLTIEPVKQAVPERREIRGFNAPVPLDRETWALTYREALSLLGENCGAVVVTLKDSSGTVYFDSAAALSGTVHFLAEETDVALDAALSGSLHTVARISCFHDPKAANRETETMGLMNHGGFVFYDANNSQWLDPAKPAARAYLCALAREAAELGFDEILLADVTYPIEGKLDKIAYGEIDRAEVLDDFLTEMRAALEPYGVMLSLEVPEAMILQGENEDAGLHMGKIASHVECIYAVTTPEQAGLLSLTVEQAGDAEFIPELETVSDSVTGSFLIF